MKLKLISFFLILMFIVFVFGSIITFTYNSNVSEIEKASKSFYEKNTLFFNVTSSDVKYNEIYKTLPMNTLLYSILPSNIDIRGVVYKGKINTPYLKKGHFFSKEDFKRGIKLAVVGEDIPTIERNGKQFFDFNNESYEVIGILGYRMPTKLDRMVMLTLNDNLLQATQQFSISGSNLQLNYNFLGNEKLFGKVYVIDKKTFSILHIIDSTNSHIITSAMFIIIITLNTFILVYFWLVNKNNEIIIKKINGFTYSQILADLYIEFVKIVSIALFIGTFFSYIFIINRYTFNFKSIILSYILTFFIYTIYFIIINKIRFGKISKRKFGVIE